MRLIAVSLNANDWFVDNYKLFDYGFDNYKLYTLYNRGQLLKKIEMEKSNEKDLILVSEMDLLYPLKEDEIKYVKINMDVNREASLPIEAGETYGSVKIYVDGKIIRNDSLIAKYQIDKKNIIERIIDLFGS